MYCTVITSIYADTVKVVLFNLSHYTNISSQVHKDSVSDGITLKYTPVTWDSLQVANRT